MKRGKEAVYEKARMVGQSEPRTGSSVSNRSWCRGQAEMVPSRQQVKSTNSSAQGAACSSWNQLRSVKRSAPSGVEKTEENDGNGE